MPRPLLVFALLLGGSRLAAAAPRLDVAGCPPSLSRGLERFVAIELEPLIDDSDEIDVQVDCAEDTVVVLVSVDGRTQSRSMDLRTIAPSVRGRVVALTAAELVREIGALPPPAPPPEPTSPPAPVDRAPPAPPPRRTSVGELEAFFQAAQFDLNGDLVLGGGLRFAYTGFGPWRLALDFGASTFERASELGSARLVLAGLGARVGHSLPLGELGLELGAGGRVGVARISATSDDADATAGSVSGPWGAPLLFAGLAAPLGGAWRLGLDAEFGYVVLPVRGMIQDGEDIEVDELWTALSLGLAVEL